MKRENKRAPVRFTYLGGTRVLVGDVVMAANKQASIEKVIQPRSKDAKDFNCEMTGGLLLAFEDGDLQLWPSANEDLVLMHRGKEM